MLQHRSTAWAVLVLSILFTTLAWYVSERAQNAHRTDRFVYRTGEVAAAITQRMKQYENLLRGCVALFDASDSVTRDEWRTYVAALQLGDQHPGIQGLGFSESIPFEKLQEHEHAIRAAGFPTYAVWPPGERAEYHAIVYLEPFEGRNLRAFGFDMHSEPKRSAAMDSARDSGRPAITAPVVLVQETDRDVQPGFLMYVPVYRRGMPLDTVSERQRALRGFVYAPFRSKDLMGGILGSQFKDLDYWVYDGSKPSPSHLLFRSHNAAAAELTWTRQLAVGDRQWTITFAGDAASFDDGRAQPMVIACMGLIIDVMLFLMVSSLARTQQRALRIAGEMTRELRRSLGEKEVLLQEVHHRVKNNLQVISSLISLQLHKPENEGARDALEECRGRVFAIALIHEKLYRVADFSRIQFDDYVRDLSQNFLGAAQPQSAMIRLELALQPVLLDVEQAIPCGLILQELLSNVLKHAFPQTRQGTVQVELSEGAEEVTLAVRDDGVGFPASFDHEAAPSLGIKLVHILAEQIGARCQIEAQSGTRAAIRFARHAKAA